jgi:hypothetical protein
MGINYWKIHFVRGASRKWCSMRVNWNKTVQSDMSCVNRQWLPASAAQRTVYSHCFNKPAVFNTAETRQPRALWKLLQFQRNTALCASELCVSIIHGIGTELQNVTRTTRANVWGVPTISVPLNVWLKFCSKPDIYTFRYDVIPAAHSGGTQFISRTWHLL